MDKIFIYKCEKYDLEKIKRIIKNIFFESGFNKKLEDNDSVFLKLNLLRGAAPEKSVTTHPVFVRAVVEVLLEKDLKVIIGDSPAGPFSQFLLKNTYKECGLLDELKDLDVEFNYNTDTKFIHSEKALRLRDFEVFERILETDLLINLPKLKTHTMMRYTGAVKNMFGAIAGLTKADYHFRLQEGEEFAEHLIDICETIKPDFNLMDGIMAMEGDGPSGGESINSKAIIGGENPYALDKVATEYISFSEDYVYTVKASKNRKLYENIKVYGDEIYPIEFKKPKATQVTFLPNWLPEPIQDFLIDRLKAKIIFDLDKCIKCGHCGRSCPVKIINYDIEGYPYYNEKECINCFCCHEVCPVDAIDVKNPFISSIIRRV